MAWLAVHLHLACISCLSLTWRQVAGEKTLGMRKKAPHFFAKNGTSSLIPRRSCPSIVRMQAVRFVIEFQSVFIGISIGISFVVICHLWSFVDRFD